jgi:protein-S-isoprenylcysteine O-methyltransferase Ste14
MKCLTAACTPRELLTNLHTQAIMCKDPIRDRSVMYRTVVICCFVLAVAAIFIRYATHFTIGGSNNNWPDNIMLALLLVGDYPM